MPTLTLHCQYARVQLWWVSRVCPAFVRWVAAGAVLALGGREAFAGGSTSVLCPVSALFPVQVASPDDPGFSTQPLWPDDRRYKASIYSPQNFLSLFEQDHQAASKSSTSLSSGALNFSVDSDFRDTTKTDGRSFLGFFMGNTSKWQENQVGYTNMKMDLGETVRVNTRFGASTYEASTDFFNSLNDKKSPEDRRAARFANIGPASGTATLSRIEEDVLKFGNAKVMLYQEFARVDPFFEDVKFSDKALRQQTKDDVFSKPDRETGKYGISLIQGSSGVTLSQSLISNISEGPISFYREQRFDSKAWLGLRDVYKDYWNSGSFLENFVPNTVWIGYSVGSVRRNGPDLPAAAATNINAGAFWQWADVYASMSAWRSLESSLQQVNNLGIRSFSDGADLSVGVQNKRWRLSGYVSITRSTYEDAWSNTSNNSTNGGVSFSLLFERLPNLTLAFDVSNYADNYVYTMSNGLDGGRYSTGGVALDFSKYLKETNKQKLQLFYYARKEGYDSYWGAVSSQNLTLAHVFGGVMRTRW